MSTESILGKYDEQPAAASEPRIHNGFYTLTFPDGGHRTFRIWTKRDSAKFAPGKRIIGILIGPENTTDYEAFAFLNDDGFQVWKRFAGAKDNPSKYQQYAGILWSLANGEEIEGYELLVSRRCLVCNRTLTDDESIRIGIGPTCRGRI